MEYGNLYRTTSHLYDVGINLVYVLRMLTLQYNTCKCLAFASQGVWQIVYNGFVRMCEIKLLTHPDVYARRMAKSTLQVRMQIELPEVFENMSKWYTDARIKRSKDRLGGSSSSSS